MQGQGRRGHSAKRAASRAARCGACRSCLNPKKKQRCLTPRSIDSAVPPQEDLNLQDLTRGPLTRHSNVGSNLKDGSAPAAPAVQGSGPTLPPHNLAINMNDVISKDPTLLYVPTVRPRERPVTRAEQEEKRSKKMRKKHNAKSRLLAEGMGLAADVMQADPEMVSCGAEEWLEAAGLLLLHDDIPSNGASKKDTQDGAYDHGGE